jgi:hypothetical protein
VWASVRAWPQIVAAESESAGMRSGSGPEATRRAATHMDDAAEDEAGPDQEGNQPEPEGRCSHLRARRVGERPA